MKNKAFAKYYFFILAAVVLLSFYPLYMGAKVVMQMIENGAVAADSYPKYVIPYAPIAVALILTTLLLPLIQKIFKKHRVLIASAFSLGLFYAVERLMETQIIVRAVQLDDQFAELQSWQMSLCIASPNMYGTQSWTMVDVLLGGYSPAFKLHFYLVSAVLLISLVNCIYGYGDMISTGSDKRKKALAAQTVSAILFLGMCIWACFTAFYRTGEIKVPAVSAVLLSVFFALLGVSVGTFVASLTAGKKPFLQNVLPSVFSSAVTTLMYVGEMILLGGKLYRFGDGSLFDGLPLIVLSPVDVFVVICSFFITFAVCRLINRKTDAALPEEREKNVPEE